MVIPADSPLGLRLSLLVYVLTFSRGGKRTPPIIIGAISLEQSRSSQFAHGKVSPFPARLSPFAFLHFMWATEQRAIQSQIMFPQTGLPRALRYYNITSRD